MPSTEALAAARAYLRQRLGRPPFPPAIEDLAHLIDGFIASNDAFDLAETLVNHQWGVSVQRLAAALDSFRAAGVREVTEAALKILHEEGWLGNSENRIRKLADDPRCRTADEQEATDAE